VTQQANLALRTFTTYGCAGAGVDTIAIERVRDTFYDMRYWDNQSKYGEFSVKQYYMKTLEDYLDDDSTSGFKSIFNQFSAALQSVTTNSSSEASKKQFIASAKALTDYFNNMYGNLQELQKDINLEIKQSVDQINSISQKIATLNKQINVVELSGASANELRDQRDLLIDELSEYVDVEVEEMPIVDVYHPERETGGHRYLVRIAGGQPLVDGNSYNTLSYVARTEGEKLNQSDADGMYRIMWANGNEFNLQNAAMGGKLKGLAQLRDGNNGANFKGVVDSVDTANHKVSIKVDSQYLKDMKGCTLSSTGGEINIGNTLYYYTGWEFDGVDTYTFTLDDNRLPQIDAGKVGKDVKVSSEVKYQGIPYYMEQMNEWIRGFAEAVNNIFTQGVDANGNQGCIFFTGFDGTGKEYTEDDFVAAGTPGVAGANGYYELTAGNFAINSALLADANLLGTRSSADVGVEECGQIKELISMLTSKDKFSFRNGTAGQMLEMLLSDMALNASNANTFYNTYNGLRNSIDNQRSSISGVDEDEEAVSLVKFQNSYTLASKMIQTLTEVYDQLILRTGV
jgi:flagellar hook-associated protein 1 FlgK